MRCAIWYHLYNVKNVKNTHGGVLISVQLRADALREHSSIGVFHFFKIVQMIPNRATHHISSEKVNKFTKISFYRTEDRWLFLKEIYRAGTLNPFNSTGFLQMYPESSSFERKPLVFCSVSGSIEKKTVPWNRSNTFLKHIPAECRHSCLFHIKPCFPIVNLHCFLECIHEV